MKLTLRIFNVIIMALSLVATVLLFSLPTMTFRSKVAMDVKTFSSFVPDTQFSGDYDVPELIGTDTIYVGINFDLYFGQTAKIMGGNRDIVNEEIIVKNADEIIDTLHEPIDLITDYSIRATIKRTIEDEIYKQVEEARVKFAEEHGGHSTTEEILEDVGMDDAYFTTFADDLYDSANKDDATMDSVSDVLYFQIDEAVHKSEKSGMVDTSGFTDDKRNEIGDNLVNIFSDLKLVNEDGSLKKISLISYIYISQFIANDLASKVADKSVLEQKADETITDYADRLLGMYVLSQMPEQFYTVVGYVALALFIGLFLFTGIWVGLFVITLVKTLTPRPWTIFGVWFWIIGSLQLILGFGITILTKFVIAKLPIPLEGTPIHSFALAIRTSVVIPSILFLVCIPLAIVYSVFKGEQKMRVHEDRQIQKEAK